MSDITITKITPPEVGWPVFYHCAGCKTTEIVLVPWANKPGDGDYLVVQMCIHPTLIYHHYFYPYSYETNKGDSNG